LPDGIFSHQKDHFGYTLEDLAIENAGILFGHFLFYVAIWNIYGNLLCLMAICKFCGHLCGICFPFWYVAVARKIWQPLLDTLI
jgi:hypothetical protein